MSAFDPALLLDASRHDMDKEFALATENIGDRNIEEPLIRFCKARAENQRPLQVESLLEFIRNIRLAHRGDLMYLCENIVLSIDDDKEVISEYVRACIDIADWPRLQRFFETRPDITVDLHAISFTKILSNLNGHPAHAIEVWPNESIAYAAKTSVFNLSTVVITRQRAMIESLLKHIEAQSRQ